MQHSVDRIPHPVSDRPDHSWICAQIGSREHYSIPRALHQSGRLKLFLTDFWAEDSRIMNWLPEIRRKKVAERSHPELANAPIVSPGDSRFFFDFRQKLFRRSSWETTIRRNQWFQDAMLRQLRGCYRDLITEGQPGTFFSYSYAAKDLFRFFRSHGWRTILGQVDPGPREEEIVASETEREMELNTSWERPPRRYWELWREECEMADEIWVNSPWSSEALVGERVPAGKIRVVPLVYSEESGEVRKQPKKYPPSFSKERPMRVLFLGRVTLRKGAHLLLRAARQMAGEPIEFWMVGPTEIKVPEPYRDHPQFRWTGPVSRSEAVRFYRDADIFVLPTLSDGFALTQLEAQSHGLPLLASRYCGQVVRNGENGLLLDPLNEDNIVKILRYCVRHPEELSTYSGQSRVSQEFHPSALVRFLNDEAPNADSAELKVGASQEFQNKRKD